jgi:hypothetical protein
LGLHPSQPCPCWNDATRTQKPQRLPLM